MATSPGMAYRGELGNELDKREDVRDDDKEAVHDDVAVGLLLEVLHDLDNAGKKKLRGDSKDGSKARPHPSRTDLSFSRHMELVGIAICMPQPQQILRSTTAQIHTYSDPSVFDSHSSGSAQW